MTDGTTITARVRVVVVGDIEYSHGYDRDSPMQRAVLLEAETAEDARAFAALLYQTVTISASPQKP